MYRFLSVLALAVLLFSCHSSRRSGGINQLSSAEKKAGWQLLFDGKSTGGWHQYGNKPLGKAWMIQDGCLYLDSSIPDGGDIVTDGEYTNFHLQVEWKISPNGNSGIIFYIDEDKGKYKYPWETGMEMQVLDNAGHPDGKIKTHRAGDLYDILSVSKETVKAPGEWNLAEIICRDGKLDFFLNGENTVTTTLWDAEWKKRVAGSKFKNMPAFGTYKKGRIGLQDHGDKVWFRNIRIREL